MSSLPAWLSSLIGGINCLCNHTHAYHHCGTEYGITFSISPTMTELGNKREEKNVWPYYKPETRSYRKSWRWQRLWARRNPIWLRKKTIQRKKAISLSIAIKAERGGRWRRRGSLYLHWRNYYKDFALFSPRLIAAFDDSGAERDLHKGASVNSVPRHTYPYPPLSKFFNKRILWN